MSGDARLTAAAIRWGEHPAVWPVPYRSAPRWWQFRARRNEREFRDVFGDFDREAFWNESGQSVYEDAGGAMLRQYKAMLGVTTEEPYTYRQAIDDLTAGRAALSKQEG